MATFGHATGSHGASAEDLSPDYAIAFGPYTLPANATLTTISVYLSNANVAGSFDIRCAVYANNSGAPGALLGTTTARSLNGGAWGGDAYYDFTFSANPSLTAANYWLAVQMGNSIGNIIQYSYDAVASGRQYHARAYGSSFQDPFGTPDGTDNHQGAIYATYTTAAAPVADFTGTPLSGTSPLSVTFTDASTGSPTSWLWEKSSDGGSTWGTFSTGSTQQNPTETFT